MAKKKQHGSVKRFGARYGRTLRETLSKIEAVQHQTNKCPYCAYTSVTRLAAGIWECKKCAAKFTNRAYTVIKTSKKIEEQQLMEAETKDSHKKTSEKGVRYKDVVGVIEEQPVVQEETNIKEE